MRAVWRNESNASLSVYANPAGVWLWKDHATDESGNALDFLLLAGYGKRDAAALLKSRQSGTLGTPASPLRGARARTRTAETGGEGKARALPPLPEKDAHALEVGRAALVADGLPVTLERRGLDVELASRLGLGRRGGDALLPVYGPTGDVQAVKVRREREAGGKQRYGYLSSGRGSPTWYAPGFQEARAGVLIVEGELNAGVCWLALEARGLDGLAVVGLPGAEGSPDWAQIQERGPVYVLTDHDKAGDKGWRRLAREAEAAGVQVERLGSLDATAQEAGDVLDACNVAHRDGLDGLAERLAEQLRACLTAPTVNDQAHDAPHIEARTAEPETPEATEAQQAAQIAPGDVQTRQDTAQDAAPVVREGGAGEGDTALPRGWKYDREGWLCRVKPGRGDNPDTLEPVYHGKIEVCGSGADLHTGTEQLRVRFYVRGRRVEVAAPRAELGKARGILDTLGARGAPVHEKNARDVGRFLIEQADLLADTLGHEAFSERYGLVMHGAGAVLPLGSVGVEGRYVGPQVIRTGTDANAYRHALQEVVSWGDEAWPVWLALGLSLSSPLLGRLRLRRNPVLYLAGESGVGKTTVAQFAAGVWGDPTSGPLRVEAGRTTRAGLIQSFTHLGGLPVFVDEAHMSARMDDLEAAVYQFANGESYTRGGVDGKTRGGEELHGALLIAGETLPGFKNAGAHRRVLFLEAHQVPPLGAEAGSAEGRRRAETLETAFQSGAGLLGDAFARWAWDNWDAFREGMNHWRGDQGGPWAEPLAAAVQAVASLGDVLGVQVPESVLLALLAEPWAALERATAEHDPASEAWDALGSLLSSAWQATEADTQTLRLPGGELLAWHPVHEPGRWRLIPSGRAVGAQLGAAWVQRYGPTWIKRGWVEAHKDGGATHVTWNSGLKRSIRVLLLIPQAEKKV
ncbi:DUF927 domain-containing protein (plasmid) [Deinococcus aquaticus]|uniref:DUF927 domain-containing protein n=2 Tax=Deinococcus aquaticus TaxID=328692 RepID=A0ABY7V8X4_9DEIO|nr:DUF927 domain-containing protein [Deinococcus aquaticus]WDA60821.1 DUF927 domain-containing protein [Deinococcus aquaticus]